MPATIYPTGTTVFDATQRIRPDVGLRLEPPRRRAPVRRPHHRRGDGLHPPRPAGLRVAVDRYANLLISPVD